MTKPNEQEWVADLFTEMLKEGAPERRAAFAARSPVLLSAAALKMLLAQRSDEKGVACLQLLDEMRLYLWDHPESYPEGEGPLDPIVKGLRTGELSFSAALGKAIGIECAGLLSNTYLHVLFVRFTDALEQSVTFAAQAATLALESAWAMPFPTIAPDVKLSAAKGFIHVVHGALMKRPDGGLLDRADAAGRWALEEADRRARPELRGELLNMLGTMTLDAYASRWAASPEYLATIGSWLARAATPMPAPQAALARAVDLLSQAVDRQPAGERGATLKALMQATVFEACSRGAEPDRAGLGALAEQAFQNLDRTRDAEARKYVEQILEVYGIR
jgi:hypothetical protein